MTENHDFRALIAAAAKASKSEFPEASFVLRRLAENPKDVGIQLKEALTVQKQGTCLPTSLFSSLNISQLKSAILTLFVNISHQLIEPV